MLTNFKEGKISLRAFIMVVLGMALLFFILGWVFPVEGPFDYVYDDYASQPAHKHSASYAPPQPKQFIIDINDLSEEDFEAFQEIFTNK